MKTFEYVATDENRKVKRGEVKAQTLSKATEKVIDAGLTILNIEEKISFFNFQKLNEINIGGVPIKEKVVFMRQLSTMISAGISLTNALEILASQITNPAFKKAVADIEQKVAGGMPFNKALATQKGIFDQITINLIKAGEESGNLDVILERLATELENDQEFRSKIKSAMTYPIIVILVMIVVVALLMIYMIPTMKDMFAEFGDNELPLITRIVIDISDALVKWKLHILIGSVLGIIFLKKYYETPSGKKNIDKILLKIPIIGQFIQKVQVALFSRVMYLLIKSGVDIIDVLDLTAGVLSNYWFQHSVKVALDDVKKGVPLALPLSRSEHFPPLVSKMIAIGEESGKLEDMLAKLTEYYDREVKHLADSLSSIMEPLLLVVMGIVVGFVVVAIYAPIFQLSTIIK